MKNGDILTNIGIGLAIVGLAYYLLKRQNHISSFATAVHQVTHPAAEHHHNSSSSHTSRTTAHTHHPHSNAPRHTAHNNERKATGHPHNVHKTSMKISREQAADDQSMRNQVMHQRLKAHRWNKLHEHDTMYSDITMLAGGGGAYVSVDPLPKTPPGWNGDASSGHPGHEPDYHTRNAFNPGKPINLGPAFPESAYHLNDDVSRFIAPRNSKIDPIEHPTYMT